jgi:hypothetical protein
LTQFFPPSLEGHKPKKREDEKEGKGAVTCYGGTVTYYDYDLNKGTYVTVYKGEIESEFYLKEYAEWFIKVFRGSSTIICSISFIFSYFFFILTFASIVLLVSILTGLVTELISYLLGHVSVLETDTRDSLKILIFLEIAIVGIYVFRELFYFFVYLREYYKNSTCGKCGKYLACGESRKPDLKVIDDAKKHAIIKFSYWKCKFCGYENVRESDITPKNDYYGGY